MRAASVWLHGQGRAMIVLPHTAHPHVQVLCLQSEGGSPAYYDSHSGPHAASQPSPVPYALSALMISATAIPFRRMASAAPVAPSVPAPDLRKQDCSAPALVFSTAGAVGYKATHAVVQEMLVGAGAVPQVVLSLLQTCVNYPTPVTEFSVQSSKQPKVLHMKAFRPPGRSSLDRS